MAAVGLKLGVALGLVLFALLVLFFSVHVVPAISAKIVDAVSGRPLAGMNVCLEVSVRGSEGSLAPRSEETQPDPSGRFSFSASIMRTDLFQSWHGYSVRVTDPGMDVVPHCGPFLSGAYFSTFVVGAKLAPLDKIDQPFYFPVAVVSQPPMPPPVRYNALLRKMGFPVGGRIALIPLLRNVEECQPIEDSDLAASCSELNNSAAASALRELSQGTSLR